MIKEKAPSFDVGAARYCLLVCVVELISNITFPRIWAGWESAYSSRFGWVLVGDLDYIRVAISLLEVSAVLVAVIAIGILVMWRWRLRVIPMNYMTLCVVTAIVFSPEILTSHLVALFLSAVQTKCSLFLDNGDIEFLHRNIVSSNQSTAVCSILVLVLFFLWAYHTFFLNQSV